MVWKKVPESLERRWGPGREQRFISKKQDTEHQPLENSPVEEARTAGMRGGSIVAVAEKLKLHKVTLDTNQDGKLPRVKAK